MRYLAALAAVSLVACAPAAPSATAEPLGAPLPISMEEAGDFWVEHTFRCDRVRIEAVGMQTVRCTVDSTGGGAAINVEFTGDGAGVRELVASMDFAEVSDPEQQLVQAQGFFAGTLPWLLGNDRQAMDIQEWLLPRLASGATGVLAGLRLELDVTSSRPSLRITSE